MAIVDRGNNEYRGMTMGKAYSVYIDGRYTGRVNGFNEQEAVDNARSKWRVEHGKRVSVMLIPY